MSLSPAPAPLAPEAEAADWAAARAGAAGARERLFELYAPLARRIAARCHRARGRGDLDLGDLRQLAYAGLLEAMDRYDPTRGAPFQVFAGRRITGSVLDGMARMTEMRQQASFRHRIQSERTRSLAAQAPDGISGTEALDLLGDLIAGLALGFMLDAAGLAAGPGAADSRAGPYDSLEWRDALRRVVQEIDDLPPREAAVVRGHYLEGVEFEQIGRLLGVSKGRVSQLHRAGLERLRRRMAPDTEFRMER